MCESIKYIVTAERWQQNIQNHDMFDVLVIDRVAGDKVRGLIRLGGAPAVAAIKNADLYFDSKGFVAREEWTWDGAWEGTMLDQLLNRSDSI